MRIFSRPLVPSLVLLFTLFAFGCSDDIQVLSPVADGAQDTNNASDMDITGSEDSALPPGEVHQDTSADTAPPEPSYPEWFQKPCGDNEDCIDEDGNTGWCVQVNASGETQCTVDCQTECPPGYGCVGIQNQGGADGLLVCMPNNPTSCNECISDEDCIYQGARCLQVGFVDGEADYRCAESCAETRGACADADNYDCVLTVLEEGGAAEALCIPKTKSCVCFGQDSDGNDIDGSYQTCTETNEFGTCVGNEVCDGENGWTGCVAATPLEEVCDGVDNDCDEATDEDLPVEACTNKNAFGSCEGTNICEGVDGWTCDAAVPAPESCDGVDNDCDDVTDEDQSDTDDDGTCDGLDDDDDNDTVADEVDNCPLVANTGQTDTDNDGEGDACDADQDGDTVLNADDNCPLVQNEDQNDLDEDEIGDACDPDADGDGKDAGEASDCNDSNPLIYNDAPELCDGLDNNCNNQSDEGFVDTDSDNAADCIDSDDDNDGYLDACDPEDADCTVDCAPLDADIHPDAEEACDGVDNNCADGTDEGFADLDEDSVADCVDSDLDGDDTPNDEDNCISTANADQQNNDDDALGDACDPDDDNDTVLDDEDNCVTESNLEQTDLDGDLLGDACDSDKDGDGHIDVSLPGGTDCEDTDPDVFDGSEEVCDGKDNNCDQWIDEGFPDTDDDQLANCVDPDDDGDGIPDVLDNCPLTANDGQENNDDDEQGDLCDDNDDNDADLDDVDCAPFDASIHSEATELCDEIDSNCDNSIVDEFTDTDDNKVPDCVDEDDDGDGEPDDTDCAPLDNTLQIASPETCDGEDNDCNGVPDDNLAPLSCGEGVCEHSVASCINGVPQSCNPFEGASEEICDGKDNDCNGFPDDNLPLIHCGKGDCAQSVASCLNGVPQSCNPFEGASEEICDGLDNNCNGSVTDEEGLPTGLCEQCSNGSGTNVPNGNDPFNQCTGQSCASANYHHGWVSNTCLYNGAQYGNHCDGAGSCETAASGCSSGSIPGPSTGVTRGTCQSMSGCSGTAGPSTNAVAAGSDPHGDCANWKTCNGGTSCCASMNNWNGNWNVSVNETCKGEGTYPNLNFSMNCGASSGGNYGGSVTCNYFITGEVNGTCIITITRTGCNSFNLKYSACSLPGPSYSANAPINMNNHNSGSGSFSSTLGDCGTLSVHR